MYLEPCPICLQSDSLSIESYGFKHVKINCHRCNLTMKKDWPPDQYLDVIQAHLIAQWNNRKSNRLNPCVEIAASKQIIGTQPRMARRVGQDV